MSFYASSEDIRTIEEGRRTWLVGRARRADGSWQDIKLDLDNIIGNNNGRLTWGGQGFTETASDVRFSFEGGTNVPILRARLRNAEGGEQESDLNLGERLTNENGDLVFS
ncbi:Cyanovirin-N [Tuber brumale]|nr:Cyanovirin-N [Tuber brumale]